MEIEEIRQHVDRRPFKPFILETFNDHIEVKCREEILMSPSRDDLVAVVNDKGSICILVVKHIRRVCLTWEEAYKETGRDAEYSKDKKYMEGNIFDGLEGTMFDGLKNNPDDRGNMSEARLKEASARSDRWKDYPFMLNLLTRTEDLENDPRFVAKLERGINRCFTAVINFKIVDIRGCQTLSMILQTIIIVFIGWLAEWLIFSSLHFYDPAHWKP